MDESGLSFSLLRGVLDFADEFSRVVYGNNAGLLGGAQREDVRMPCQTFFQPIFVGLMDVHEFAGEFIGKGLYLRKVLPVDKQRVSKSVFADGSIGELRRGLV